MFKFINRILERLRGARPDPLVVTEVRLLNTLTQVQYEALEKKAHAVTIVNSTTTELQAGYQLGLQHALKVVREGWVA